MSASEIRNARPGPARGSPLCDEVDGAPATRDCTAYEELERAVAETRTAGLVRPPTPQREQTAQVRVDRHEQPDEVALLDPRALPRHDRRATWRGAFPPRPEIRRPRPRGGHRSPPRDDPAAGDDHDVLTDVLDEVELMAGEHNADACRRPFPEDLGHRRDADRIQTGERLVKDKQLRIMDQGGAELDALLVAMGERLQLVLRPVARPVVRRVSLPRRQPWACHGAGRSSSSAPRPGIRGYRPRCSGM